MKDSASICEKADLGNGAGSFEARVASGTSGGNIDIRLDSIDGPLIGTCPIGTTEDWQTWTTVSANVYGASGTHDLYLNFAGSDGYLFNMNWWRFNTVSNETLGDLNGDGNVNSIDFALLRKHLLGITPLAGTALSNADVNKDGNVNSIDFALMRMFILGMISSFPG